MQSQKETEVGQVLQSYIVHSFEAPAHRCTMHTQTRRDLVGDSHALVRQITGQAARSARQRGDRAQKLVELNSKLAVRDERNEKVELEVNIEPWFPPSAMSKIKTRPPAHEKSIRLGASLLRQNVFDQLEYRRQVLVLRSG